jgi:uncharacterized protein
MNNPGNDADVILLGASTRAAAGSALRAGWIPWCIDLFADADLQNIAVVRKVPMDAYPHGLLEALTDAPQAPVIYTGALENRPDLIARIDRPLWGNSPTVLRAIRDPSQWTSSLHAHGLPCPALVDAPTAGRWLLKPRKSGGGLGIQLYVGQAFNPRTHFLQEWIDGVPMSAVYLGQNDDATLLGVTQQLIGTPWLNATGFHYAGNIGPLRLESVPWQRLGAALAKAFHLRGLFGIDAILCDGVPFPVEINPRYTASVEIVERAYKRPLLQWHGDVFRGRSATPVIPPNERLHGKAILYARETLAFPERGPWLEDETEYADIPHAGEIIEQGRPVLTLFTSGATAAECETNLREKAQALDRSWWA